MTVDVNMHVRHLAPAKPTEADTIAGGMIFAVKSEAPGGRAIADS